MSRVPEKLTEAEGKVKQLANEFAAKSNPRKLFPPAKIQSCWRHRTACNLFEQVVLDPQNKNSFVEAVVFLGASRLTEHIAAPTLVVQIFKDNSPRHAAPPTSTLKAAPVATGGRQRAIQHQIQRN